MATPDERSEDATPDDEQTLAERLMRGEDLGAAQPDSDTPGPDEKFGSDENAGSDESAGSDENAGSDEGAWSDESAGSENAASESAGSESTAEAEETQVIPADAEDESSTERTEVLPAEDEPSTERTEVLPAEDHADESRTDHASDESTRDSSRSDGRGTAAAAGAGAATAGAAAGSAAAKEPATESTATKPTAKGSAATEPAAAGSAAGSADRPEENRKPAKPPRTTDRPLGALALLVLRIVTGLIFGVHGVQKLLDIPGTREFFGELPLPEAELFGLITAGGELCVALGLVLGLAVRIAGLGAMAIAIGALVLVRWTDWPIAGSPAGFSGELELLLAAVGFVFFMLGGGRIGLDRMFRKNP